MFKGMNGWDDRTTMGTTGWSGEYIEPDILLPSQFFAKGFATEPERELVLAIFIDAISCVCDARTKARYHLDAIEWFEDTTSRCEWRFTFLHCCEILGYNEQQWRTWARAYHGPNQQFRRKSINRIRRPQHHPHKQLHEVESIS